MENINKALLKDEELVKVNGGIDLADIYQDTDFFTVRVVDGSITIFARKDLGRIWLTSVENNPAATLYSNANFTLGSYAHVTQRHGGHIYFYYQDLSLPGAPERCYVIDVQVQNGLCIE